MHVVNVGSELAYRVDSPTSFVFNIAPAFTPHQNIKDENLVVTPNLDFEWCMLNEHGVRGLRVNALQGDFKIKYSATVELSPEVRHTSDLNEVSHPVIPTEVLQYLYPSRYCESDRLGRFAMKQFGALEGGYSRVQAICDWVYNNLDYISGSTDASSGACDVLIQRAGVCRDFAHVSVALCRALGIPARYVGGYAAGLEPPDFHGFFEAYLNEDWYLFDATKMAPVSGFVRVGIGRDAADTSFANIVGDTTFVSMHVSAVAISPQQPNPEDAISMA